MLKLIEKTIDRIFEDNTNLLMLLSFIFLILLLVVAMGQCAYQSKLDTELKLAKIAAGQVVEDVRPRH